LAQFQHADFATLRMNRMSGTMPDTGYFRLAAFTYIAERALADCTSSAYRFPAAVQSGPKIALTSPASNSINVTSPYPATVNVNGTASDVDGNLISWRVTKRKSTDSTETTIEEAIFPPTDNAACNVDVQLGEAGTHYIYVRAFDNFGLSSEVVITVTAAAGTNQVARPEFYYDNRRIPNQSNVSKTSGLLELRCATPGAAIRWRHYATSNGVFTGWTTFDSTNPATWPTMPDKDVLYGPSGFQYSFDRLQAQATKTDWTSSAVAYLNSI
jgi:hypothetical protein